jgi:hypothetical protein
MFASFNRSARRKKLPLQTKTAIIKRKGRKFLKWNLIAGFFAVVLIILLFTLFVKFISSDRFRVKSFSIIGEKSVSESELKAELSPLTEQNIFFIRGKSIQKTLSEKYAIFKIVKVKKIWPDRILININEREPKLAIINLYGAYVVDEDAKIIEIITQDKTAFSDQEILIIKNLGDPDAKYISDIIFPTWKAENPKATDDQYKFSDISLEKKTKALSELNNSLSAKAEERFESFQKKISETKYAALERVVVYENKEYIESDYIDENMLKLTTEVVSFFNITDKQIINHVYWKGNYLLEIELGSGKIIIFSTHRDNSEQLEDYTLVKSQLSLSGKNYQEINLSSKKISVR